MAEEITLKAYIERIETMIRQGRMDEAIAHSAHVLQFYPKNAEVYRNLGRALMRLQRYEEASEIFRRLLAAIPDDFSAHYQLSIVYEQEKNGNAALWHIERAFDQQPNSAQVNDRLRDLYKKFKEVDVDKIQLTAGAVAIQYNKSGMYDEAISLLQRTLVKVPDRVDLITLLAITQWKRGDVVDAAETALDVLKSYPYALEANRILSELWLQEERPSDAQRYLSRVEDIDPYLAYEIATDDDVPDSQFMVEELDFSKYAASLASQEQAPDWLSNIAELSEAEQIAIAEAPSDDMSSGEIDINDASDIEVAENLDWLTDLQEDSQPIVPTKKVTDDLSDLLPDDFNVPDSAGQDDTVDTGELAKVNLADDDDENDSFAELFGDLDDSAIEGTGLTGLLGEEDDELPHPVGRTTGLTGMLSKLGLEDEDADNKPETDDLSWLDEVSAGHYDTGNSEQTDSALNDIDTADDFFSEMEEDDKDDALAWLDTDNLISNDRDEDDAMSTDDLIEQSEVDPNDPMAWLQGDGIEFDDNAEDSSIFFVEDEPATIESDELSPMAWLGEDIESDEPDFGTNEFNADAEDATQEDPMAWLEDDGIEITDTNDLDDEFGTDALSTNINEDDSMAWLAESGIEIDDNQESTQAPDTNEILTGQLMNLDEDSGDIEGDPMAWLQEGGVEFLDDSAPDNDEVDNNWLDDDSVLDDLLNIADLTATEASDSIDDNDLFSDTEMQDTMNDDPDRTPEDDLSSDDEFDWLVNDESGDEISFEAQAEDDSMAWLEDAGIEIEDDGEELSFEVQADDSMAWLEDSGIEINDAPDEELPQPTGKTNLLNFLSDDGDDIEINTNLDEITEEDAFAEENVDWLRALDGEEIEDEEIASEGETFADDFSDTPDEEVEWNLDQTSEGEDFDWGDVEAIDDEQELDWMAEPSTEVEDFFLSSDAETDEEVVAEPADADWLSDLNADDNDFLDSDANVTDEEVVAEPADADWLSDLDTDDNDFLDSDANVTDEEVVAEPADADWLSDLDTDDNDFLDSDANVTDEEVVAEPADADWLSDLDTDDNDFLDSDANVTDEDAVAEPAELAWLEDVNEEQPVAETDGDWGELGDGFTDELSDDDTDEEWAVGDSFTDELDEDAVAEPAELAWLEDVNEEQPVAETDGDWGELGDGFTDELSDDDTDEEWAVGDSFTDELDEDAVAEPAELAWLEDVNEEQPVAETEDADWLSELDEDSVEVLDEVDDFEVEPLAVAATWDDDEDEDITDELVEPEPITEEEDNWLAGIGVQEEDEWDEEYYDEYEDEYELNISSTSGMSDMLETIRTSREEDDDSHLDDFEHDEPEWLKQTGELISPVENDEVDWGKEEEAMPMAEFDEFDDDEFEALSEDNYSNDDYEEELEQVDADNAPDWLNAMVPGLDLDFEAEDEGHLDEGFETRENTLRERRINESETIKDDFDWLQDIVEEETGAIPVVSDEELSTTPPPTSIAPRKQYIFSSPPVWARDDNAKENIAKTVAVASEVPDYLSDFDEFEEMEVNEYDFDETLDDEFKFESEEIVTVNDEFDEFENIEFANIDDEFDDSDAGEVRIADEPVDEVSDEFDDATLSVEDFDFNNESTVKAKAIDDETVDQFGESAFESEDDEFVIHDEIDSAFDDFSDEFDNADNVIEDELDSAFDSFDNADNVIEDELDNAFDDFSNEFDNADNVIEDELDSAFDSFDNADNVIEDELDNAFDDFSNEFDNADNVIEDELDDAFDDFSDEFDNADNVIEDELDSAFDSFDNANNVIEDELDSAFDDFSNEFDNADNVIEDELDNAFDDFDDEFDDFDDEFDD